MRPAITGGGRGPSYRGHWKRKGPGLVGVKRGDLRCVHITAGAWGTFQVIPVHGTPPNAPTGQGRDGCHPMSLGVAALAAILVFNHS